MSANGNTPSALGFTLWFTGLPCAGKTTLAAEVGLELTRRGCRVEVLDADVLRTTVCRGLGFGREDRDENVARIGWVCSMLSRHGVVSIAAVVSPYREARQRLRQNIPRFVEVYVKTPLSVCVERDVKGMYARAMAGKLPHFTGIDDPYEEPLDPAIVIETHKLSVYECVHSIIEWLEQADLLNRLRTKSFSAVAGCTAVTPDEGHAFSRADKEPTN
jgi:adenylyl-sulfate kinase